MSAWQVIAILLTGFAAGLWIGAKYGTKPVNEYHFDKVKAKGEGNEIVNVIKPAGENKDEKKKRFRLFKRKNRNDEQAQ